MAATSKGQLKFLLATKPKHKKMQPKSKGNPQQVQKAQGYQAAVARRAQQSLQGSNKQGGQQQPGQQSSPNHNQQGTKSKVPPQFRQLAAKKTPPTPPMPGG